MSATAYLSASDNSWMLASREARYVSRAYVRDFVGYEEFAASHVRRRELPHGGVVLIINFGAAWQVANPKYNGPLGRHGSFVAGVDDFASLVDCTGRAHCLQVNFTPIGARRLFGLPMHELTRRVVSLHDLIGQEADRIADRMYQAPDWDVRFDIVETAIERRLAQATVEDTGVVWAFGQIMQTHGGCSIASLAHKLDCSRKNLVERFHDHVGLPPKSFAGIIRFNRALQLIGTAQKPNLALVAAEAGYFDQSHFNRDFLTLSGITPSEFVRARLIDGDGLAA